METSSDRLRSILVIVATLATIGMNALAGAGRINGVMTSEPSDRHPTVITPDGYAFTIWALIYVGLIAFSIYQALPSKRELFHGFRTPYLLSCVLNCAWILSWHYYFIGICVLLIMSLAAILIYIVYAFRDPAPSVVEALITKGVFGIYAGWVTAAALVNFAIFLKASDVYMSTTWWNVFGIAMLLIAGTAALLVRMKCSNFLFPLAISWAATAIGVKQSGNTAVVIAAAMVTVFGLVTAGSVVTRLKDSTSE